MKEGKRMIKRTVAAVLCCSCLGMLTSCTPPPETPSDVLVGKYVITSGLVNGAVCTLKFTDTDLVEIVQTVTTGTNSQLTKFYGTYEIKGHKLSLSVFKETFNCVLFDKGIIFGRDASEFCMEDQISGKTLDLLKEPAFST